MLNIRYIKFILVILAFAAISCSKKVTTPSVIKGKQFPTVSGTSLSGSKIIFPEDYKGKKTILLVGYKQDAQFDIDRWILGLLQAGIKAEIVELPTISGMAPRVVQSFIDSGMRGGIPKEDWASVVTIYEDADKIISAFGNENPQNAHVFVLDENGAVIWTANRGYSASQIISIQQLLG